MAQEDFVNVETPNDSELIARKRLQEYLTEVGQVNVQANIGNLFAEDGYEDRFNYFCSRVESSLFRRLLVSGCSIGSEMVVAKRYGFQNIVGTEVNAEYVDIAENRLHGNSGYSVKLYDGKHLPFPDNSFTAVVSGHIIEHTPSPCAYIHEHLRVLQPGGVMFIEFPGRYHTVELHTGLPSLEWLPWPLRTIMLRYLSSHFSPFSLDKRRLYQDVQLTLKPISVWQIRLFLLLYGLSKTQVLHHYKPVPGFVRMILQKRHAVVSSWTIGQALLRLFY